MTTPLACDHCGVSSLSRTLRTKFQGVRLCTECDRCHYFDDTGDPACTSPAAAMVEPKPIGQFTPAILCEQHTLPWTRDMANLGNDWSIVILRRPSEMSGDLRP